MSTVFGKLVRLCAGGGKVYRLSPPPREWKCVYNYAIVKDGVVTPCEPDGTPHGNAVLNIQIIGEPVKPGSPGAN